MSYVEDFISALELKIMDIACFWRVRAFWIFSFGKRLSS